MRVPLPGWGKGPNANQTRRRVREGGEVGAGGKCKRNPAVCVRVLQQQSARRVKNYVLRVPGYLKRQAGKVHPRRGRRGVRIHRRMEKMGWRWRGRFI